MKHSKPTYRETFPVRTYVRIVRKLRRRIWKMQDPTKERPQLLEKSFQAGKQEIFHRSFRPSDAPHVSRLMFGGFISPIFPSLELTDWEKTRTCFPDFLIQRSREKDYQVLVIGQEPIGIVGFTHYGGGRAEIIDLTIDARFRGLGLGRTLVCRSLMSKVEEGFTHLYAFTSVAYREGFHRLGFEETSRVMRLVSGGETCSVVWKF